MNIANAALETATAPSLRRPRNGKEGKISLQEFLEKYNRREDGYKYEYADGYVIKSTYTMTDPQQYIAKNLTQFFNRLEAQEKAQGYLAIEKDTHLGASKWRRPDLCYMSPLDEYEAVNGGHPKPGFVIEIVSPNDTAEYYDDKLTHYFTAGVKVVWFIYPQSEKVQIYFEDESSVTCRGDMICSAAPVLPAFALSANEVFKKPVKPV